MNINYAKYIYLLIKTLRSLLEAKYSSFDRIPIQI
jgi:hypothetical protein